MEKIRTSKAYHWPLWLSLSLSEEKRSTLPLNLIKKLNTANSYLWEALNLYDDCLDNSDKTNLLPEANRLYRLYLEICFRSNYCDSFYRLLSRTINRLDQANKKELSKFRLKIENGKFIKPNRSPDFGPLISLSDKSLALALSPIAILYSLADKPDEQKIEKTMRFFRLALSAKQLADDTKDWRADLQAGRLTRANWLVIKRLNQKTIDLTKEKINYQLNCIFVSFAAQTLGKNILYLCQKAKQESDRCGLRSRSKLVQEIISPLENNAKRTNLKSHWL